MARSLADDPRQDAVVDREAEEREADDQKARHRSAAERGGQGRRDAPPRGLRDPRVGPHGHVHSYVAGRGREDSTDGKPDRHPDVLKGDQQDEHHHPDGGDDQVLPVEISARALLDGR